MIRSPLANESASTQDAATQRRFTAYVSSFQLQLFSLRLSQAVLLRSFDLYDDAVLHNDRNDAITQTAQRLQDL